MNSGSVTCYESIRLRFMSTRCRHTGRADYPGDFVISASIADLSRHQEWKSNIGISTYPAEEQCLMTSARLQVLRELGDRPFISGLCRSLHAATYAHRASLARQPTGCVHAFFSGLSLVGLSGALLLVMVARTYNSSPVI